MKKNIILKISILLFLWLFLLAPPLTAQEIPYTPFPKGNIAWQSWGRHYYGSSKSHFVLLIDTVQEVIDSKFYNKIYYNIIDDTQKYLGGIREEEKKIYFYVSGFGEHLIYDFGLEIGDTLFKTITVMFDVGIFGGLDIYFNSYPIPSDSYFCIVKNKSIITLENGEKRNTLIVDQYYCDSYYEDCFRYDTQEWVEGLGVIRSTGFLTSLYVEDNIPKPPDLGLECICQNNVRLFSTDNECFLCKSDLIDENLMHQVILFPNPTTGELQIQSSKFKVQSVEIFDIYGKSQNVKSKKQITESEIWIDILHLPAGVYFIKVNTEQGVFVKKIIKE